MNRRRLRSGSIALGLIGLALTSPSAAFADGTIKQKPGTLGCVKESGGSCLDGVAMTTTSGSVVSPDGRNVYGVSFGGDAVTVFDRNLFSGEIAQKSGTAACVSETGTGGACVDGVALDGGFDVAVSPDGRNVYAAFSTSDSVAVFDRTAVTGELTQKGGGLGCVSETGTGGLCQDGVALDGANAVAVSPDGASVYVTSSTGGVAVFDRSSLTGSLTQKAGTAGCVTETGSGGACQDGFAISGLTDLVVSPDGESVYTVGSGADSVAVFDRSLSTGAITQKSGTDGCVSDTGSGGLCADGYLLDLARGITTSPDGLHVYVASATSDALVSFDRGSTGQLTQRTGSGACVSATGSGGLCATGTAIDGPESVAVSPDGHTVYMTSSSTTDSIAVFDRNQATGGISQKSAPAGCVSESGTAGTCQDAQSMDGALGVSVSPDGRNVYTGAITSSSIAVFDRTRFPVCVPQARTIAAGASAQVALSCSHPDGLAVTYELASSPGKGTVSDFDALKGTLTYTAGAGATGVDTIEFRALAAGARSTRTPLLVDILPAISGPAGSNGAAGATGATGATGPPGLAVAAFAKSLTAKKGKAVMLKVLSTSTGRGTLDVLRSGKRVARVTKSVKKGTNTVTWNGKVGKKAAKAGRYTLRLTVVSGAQTVTLSVPLRLR